MLKNQTLELMLPLNNESYSFSTAVQSCFSKFPLSLIPVRQYMSDDSLDYFPLMVDKIQVRIADEGFVVQSNNKAMKRFLHGDL